jgi:hypothetical protein
MGQAPQCGDDERHPLRHQPADEKHIARQPVELKAPIVVAKLLGKFQRRGELRALVERVGALASFDLDELMHNLHGQR